MTTLSLPDLFRNGNVEDVRRALARGEDVNKSASQYGVTGLMWAVYKNQNAIVELLLSQPGLDLNLIDGNSCGWTPFHYACYHNNFEALKMLLAHPSINTHNNVNDAVYNRRIVFCGNGRTPLMLAIHRDNMLCIRELLKVDGLDLDTGSETLSMEARRLIDEEKQRREMEEVKARLKREEKERKEKEVQEVVPMHLDTLEILSVEVQRLIDEEKKKWKKEAEEKEEREEKERKKQEEAAKSKREEEERKDKEEWLERNNQALRESEKRVKRMIKDCAKTIEDGKKECKELMDEFKKNEKAENAARFAALELIIEEMKRVWKKECKDHEEKENREKAENSARFAALELTIEEMIKNQKKIGSLQIGM